MGEGEFAQAELGALSDVGNRLAAMARSPPSKKSLLEVLKQASSMLSKLKQSLNQPDVHSAVKPSMDALIEPSLLKHKDEDVKLMVTKCLSEIMRIGAPDAPFSDETLKEIFELIVASFKGLNDKSNPFFHIRVNILEMVATTRSCVVMLDLQCDDLILEMFKIFFETVSEEPNNVFCATRAIMCLVLEDSEDIPRELVEVLFENLLNAKKGAIKACSMLAGSVLGRCAEKLGPTARGFLTAVLEDGTPLHKKWWNAYNDLIFAIYKRAPTLLFDIYSFAPNLLVPVIPMLKDELLSNQYEVRVRAVKAVGWLFSLRNGCVPSGFNRLHEEYVKRFCDDDVTIRIAMVEGAKKCLLADRAVEAIELLRGLGDCLEDDHSKVRTSTLDAISEYANSNPQLVRVNEGKTCLTAMGAVCIDVLKKVTELLGDAEASIRHLTVKTLSSVYRAFCSQEVEESIVSSEFLSFIPSKLIGCEQGQVEFRVQDADLLLSEQLFPLDFPVHKRVTCWISFFCTMTKEDIHALKHILCQKRRIQYEMNNYLLAQDKQKQKDEGDEEDKRELRTCLKIMSRSFMNPEKAESDIAEFFSQLRDSNLLKQFSKLLDLNTKFSDSLSILDGLTNQLGEGHSVRTLAVKCSYLLFGPKHLLALMNETDKYKVSGDQKMVETGMSLLAIFLKYFPTLLGKFDENMMELLKDDRPYMKECAIHIFAAVGEHFLEKHMTLDLLKELCTNGSSKQVKYALQVLALLAGPKRFSTLFMRLLDQLEEGVELLTDVSSEPNTEEEVILNKITQTFLRKDNVHSNVEVSDYNCANKTLKAVALKALVRVICSVKDLEGIQELFEVLVKFLHEGELSDDTKTSQVDDRLRLAAAKATLHLSHKFEDQISLQLFHATVFCARDSSIYLRHQFLNKIYKLLERGMVSHLYGCAIVFSLEGKENDSTKIKCKLAAFIEESYHRFWLRKATASGQLDAPSITYRPEYTLFYLVHILARDVVFPSGNEGGPNLDAVLPAFTKLSMFISALLYGYGGSKQEKNERVGLILNIFRKMKHAEDVTDTLKTENMYILCDIGIAITKDLSGMQNKSVENINDIPLPSSIYRAISVTGESNENVDGSHMPSSLLASLPLSMNKVSIIKDKRKAEHISKKGAQSKRNKVSESSSIDNNQLNADSVSVPEKGPLHKKRKDANIELPENGMKMHKSESAAADIGKRKRGQNYNENGKLSPKNGKKMKSAEPLKASVHKHKRAKVSVEDADKGSTSDQESGSPLASAEIESGSGSPVPNASSRSHVKTSVKTPKSLEKPKKEQLREDDLKTSTKKKRGKQAVSDSKDEKDDEASASPWGTPKSSAKKLISGSESPVKLNKKAEASPKVLIGRRVKVWWPMDKEFYQGVITSYHPSTKKYKVVYDDGDVEILKLENERWEFVENDKQSSKPASRSHDLPSSMKKDAKSQRNNSSRSDTGHEVSQKHSSSKKTKELDQPENETLLDKRNEAADGEDQTSVSGSKARSSGKKGLGASKAQGSQSEEGSPSSGKKASKAEVLHSEGSLSPTNSNESSDDVPLNAWKASRKKSRQ